MTEGYFDKDFIDSRHRYIDEIRALAEAGPPEPAEDWDAIYVFSGPEIELTDPPNDPKLTYNQTEERISAAITIAKEVTALRVRKKPADVTAEDIMESGPVVYFDGYAAHNAYLLERMETMFENVYGFPATKFVVTEGEGTKHSGDQIAKFPKAAVEGSRKLVIVSDLYHLPRIQRYLGSKYDTLGIPREKVVFSFPPASKISMKTGLGEARRIHPYFKGGHLRED